MTAGFEAVASCAEVPPGKMVLRSVNGREVLLCNVGGRFYAVENRCSHLGMPLAKGRLVGTRLTCPFHGGAFDVATGAAICFPAMRPVAQFAVRVTDGTVEVGPP